MEERNKQFVQAARDGDLELVKNLLQKGVDVNSKIEGNTALHLASQNGHKEVVQILLNAGEC